MYIRTHEGLGQQSESETKRRVQITPRESGKDDKPFVKHTKGGYKRVGRGRVDKVLTELRDSKRLSISDADIEMLQRIANVETWGQIQAINSYDNAFMTMGFMQLTIKYCDAFFPDGKLQRLIRRAPDAFRSYGIELEAARRYKILESEDKKSGKKTYYKPIAIKGAEKPNDLRSLDWAKRFYSAGLDRDVIVKEAELALEVIEETKNRIVNTEVDGNKIGSSFMPFYESSVILRALIQATANHRPKYLYRALKRAIERASKLRDVSTDKFLELVRDAIKEVYKANGISQRAENLICKTKFLNTKGHCS